MTTKIETHELVQGSPEWLQFRLTKFGASEAAAMLGISPYVKRNELLHMKATGTAQEFSDWFQEHVLNNGHRVEALARPFVETKLDDILYPVTRSRGRLSASCDGLTMDDQVAWEHKQWSESLAERMRRGEMPEEHMPQCQQVLLCTGAKRLIFTVSDGTPENMLHREVQPDPVWFARLESGWVQFERDMQEFKPAEPAPVVVAAPVEHLPALSVQVNGALAIVSNLEPFGVALKAFVARIPAKPNTDQEFADTDAACKRLKEAEDRLQQAEDSALASMSDVETMRRMVADFRGIARTARLASEKMVAARKTQIRDEEIARGRAAVLKHVDALNERLGQRYMPQMPCDFAAAIKNLRTIDSLRNAIDTRIANFKIDANAVADRIAVNMRALVAAGDKAAFPDAAMLVLKAPDDLQAVIANRVAETERRLEAERERIRVEEAARAEREAAARAAEQRAAEERAEAQRAAEQRERDAQEARAAAAAATPPAPASVPTQQPSFGARPAVKAEPPAEPVDVGPPLKLGDINAALGITMTAAFVTETLDVPTLPDPRGRAVLFRRAHLPLICDRLIAHIERVKDGAPALAQAA